ncbi:glycerol-3-phosphate 1-O-acyltransferase PlsY [Halocynthiibacter namhaensis]|uniref:glycerol-3-phosphate 1-O-acyltransferase PlsY n=1 Tax=Halocynthiibacter namhaensis TaxID=1290553 RepID=UPI00057924BD|nr:glycerol-3-phosphate 1-O-acyltransferase PlsY [Halocynthiibacter namhaensis]
MPYIETSQSMLLLVAVLSYLLGSVPFGMVVTRMMNLGNLRDIGSGNIGTTNVLRTGNKKAAALTLIFDAGKGALAVLIARALFAEDAAQLAGLSAFLGHLFPIWLKLHGGKGVATFLGLMLALNFWIGLLCCATWLVVAAILRISSMAALVSVATSPIWMIMLQDGGMLILSLILTILIYAKHWPNVRRLRAGTEPKIGAK